MTREYEVGMTLYFSQEGDYYTIVEKVGRFWHLLPASNRLEEGLLKTSEELDEQGELD